MKYVNICIGLLFGMNILIIIIKILSNVIAGFNLHTYQLQQHQQNAVIYVANLEFYNSI